MTPDTPTPLPGDGVAITLDRPRIMRLTLGAWRLIIKATGESPFEPGGKFWADFGTANLEKVSVVFWASLVHEDRALTREQADALADMLPFTEIIAAVSACATASMPAASRKPDDPAPAAVAA